MLEMYPHRKFRFHAEVNLLYMQTAKARVFSTSLTFIEKINEGDGLVETQDVWTYRYGLEFVR